MQQQQWIVSLKTFSWVVVALLVAAIGYAGVMSLLLYSDIAV